MISGQKIDNVDELKSKILDWLKESVGGTFSAACQSVSISRSLGYQWRQDDPEWDDKVRHAIKQSHANGGDFAESKLFKAIGDGELTAILFYLKTQHKTRGYVERVESNLSGHLALGSLPEQDKALLDEYAKAD